MHGRSDMARIISGGLFSRPKRSLRALVNRFAGAPRLWNERRHRRVTWIEGKAPDSEEAEAIREAVVDGSDQTYGEIARHAADRLYRTDHAAGWLADIGLFYAWYLLHACETLERLHGRLVWIEDGARPWP